MNKRKLINNYEDEFFEAVNKGNIKKIFSLLEKNVNINAIDDCGNTILHIESIFGFYDIVKNLFAYKPNVNIKNKFDNIPLHFAVSNSHTDIIELLIAKKSDINSQNSFKNTPLHLAAKFNYVDIIKLLIKNNANMELCNISHCTPIDIAYEHGHTESIILFLISPNLRKMYSYNIQLENLYNNKIMCNLLYNNKLLYYIVCLYKRVLSLDLVYLICKMLFDPLENMICSFNICTEFDNKLKKQIIYYYKL